MNSNDPIIQTSKQLKEKWETFSKDYSSLIETSTLTAAKLFFNKLLSIRNSFNLQKSKLKGAEIACGSGEFMEFVLSENPDFFSQVHMFDITESMTKMAYERLSKKSEKMNINVTYMGKKFKLI